MELNDDIKRVVADLVEQACAAGYSWDDDYKPPSEESIAVLVAAGVSVPPKAECEGCHGFGKTETSYGSLSDRDCTTCSGTGHVRLPERMLTDYQRRSVDWIKEKEGERYGRR